MTDLAAYLRARYGEAEATAASGSDPLRSVAEALWRVGQGYTAEDIRAVGGDGSVGWHPDSAEDVADQAMHMGHAERVLEHLVAAGWVPPVQHLADIAVKRAIVDGLPVYEARSMDTDGRPVGMIRTLTGRAYRQALLVLVQPYAGRDDFNPAWKQE